MAPFEVDFELLKRQSSTNDTSTTDTSTIDNPGWWWYSPSAYAIKWGVILAICFLFFLFLIGGYLHARRRMSKGLPPLRYHKWLVSRGQRATFVAAHPQYQNQFSFYRPHPAQGQAYPMANYGPAPPAYGEADYVPAYAPPNEHQGPNKVDPDQSWIAPPPATDVGGPSQPPRAAGWSTYPRN